MKKKIDFYIEKLHSESEIFWKKRGEKMVLDLFHEMSVRVPAYKDFLKKNNLNPELIKTIEDLNKVPLISKENYLRKYEIEDLCWDGNFRENQWDISSTSGSTGEPFYFPRTDEQNEQYALSAELYLRENFNIENKTTLYINCFALGVWIGGIFTYEAIKMLSRAGGYNLSVINPGLNKPEIYKTIKKLGQKFDQIIIGGYPPFVKDLVDEGINEKIDWTNYNLKFVFSAEGFSEDFRDYIYKRTGKHNIYFDSLNHYGTVDQGTIAHETPLSILIRRLSIKNENIFRSIFGFESTLLPTLAQYLPEIFYFEEVDSGVVCSSYSGLPLVRYDLKDHGGILNLKEVKNIFLENGIDLMGEARKEGIEKSIWNLPFVFVRERKDMSVSLSGANIYPEHVKQVIEKDNFNNVFTGKFTMVVRRDENQDAYLEINFELKKDCKNPNIELENMLIDKIVENLLKINSEYKVIYTDRGHNKAAPKLKFWEYGSSNYFAGGGKQKWSIKD